MLFSTIILIFAVNGGLVAVDLNIYSSVTEIRKIQSGVGAYESYFQNSEYADIIDGSIGWDGTPFVKQELYNSIDVLQNALVNVNPTNQCKCKTIKAKIINPDTMLLQNLETKGYFYADSRSIEYTSVRPDEGGITLRFEFKNKNINYNGTLSYLMRGITWTPNYDLFVINANNSNIRAYATIRNNQQQEYQVDNTHLYSGDLQLANAYSNNLPLRAVAKGDMMVVEASSASIQLEGEQKGFYFYSLQDKYTLRSRSSVRLPFINANVQCKFYYKTAASISSGKYNGVFQRSYDLTPDQFLPAGVLTIRDNQVLIGQSNLPDVPANYTQTVQMGEDYDVRYEIKGNLTDSNKDSTKTPWQQYALDIDISNYKDKDVNGQLDFYGSVQTNIDKTTCNSITIDGNIIHLPFKANKGGHYRCHMVVTLTWG